MAREYHRGHRLDVWLSERAWADLALLTETTKRAKIEAALARAVLGAEPMKPAPPPALVVDDKRARIAAALAGVGQAPQPAIPIVTPVYAESEIGLRDVLAWMRNNQDEEDLRTVLLGMQKWAKRLGVRI